MTDFWLNKNTLSKCYIRYYSIQNLLRCFFLQINCKVQENMYSIDDEFYKFPKNHTQKNGQQLNRNSATKILLKVLPFFCNFILYFFWTPWKKQSTICMVHLGQILIFISNLFIKIKVMQLHIATVFLCFAWFYYQSITLLQYFWPTFAPHIPNQMRCSRRCSTLTLTAGSYSNCLEGSQRLIWLCGGLHVAIFSNYLDLLFPLQFICLSQ